MYFRNFDNKMEISQRRSIIHLPLDTFIMLSIVVVLLLILTFSLGVEKGKKFYLLAHKEEKTLKTVEMESRLPVIDVQNSTDSTLKTNITTLKIEKPMMVKTNGMIVQGKTLRIKDTPVKIISTKPSEIREKYVIQLVSYRKREKALEESKRLKASGYPILLLDKGEYVVIFVGAFVDKNEAQNKFTALKKQYKDCFIRRL